jgi:predicted small secreted protein
MPATWIRSIALALLLAIPLAACGDTWRGLRKDTGDNMQSTGDAIEGAGEKVKP